MHCATSVRTLCCLMACACFVVLFDVSVLCEVISLTHAFILEVRMCTTLQQVSVLCHLHLLRYLHHAIAIVCCSLHVQGKTTRHCTERSQTRPADNNLCTLNELGDIQALKYCMWNASHFLQTFCYCRIEGRGFFLADRHRLVPAR